MNNYIKTLVQESKIKQIDENLSRDIDDLAQEYAEGMFDSSWKSSVEDFIEEELDVSSDKKTMSMFYKSFLKHASKYLK